MVSNGVPFTAIVATGSRGLQESDGEFNRTTGGYQLDIAIGEAIFMEIGWLTYWTPHESACNLICSRAW
jgi:hypothetical protein